MDLPQIPLDQNMNLDTGEPPTNLEDQFMFIKDLIAGRSGSTGLNSDQLQREMASEQMLKEIGVDIQKFLAPQENQENIHNNILKNKPQQSSSPSQDGDSKLSPPFKPKMNMFVTENDDDGVKQVASGGAGLPDPFDMPQMKSQNSSGLPDPTEMPVMTAQSAPSGLPDPSMMPSMVPSDGQANSATTTSSLPNPFSMPSLNDLGAGPSSGLSEAEKKGKDLVQQKVATLQTKAKPVPTDQQRDQFQQNHKLRMERMMREAEQKEENREKELFVKKAGQLPQQLLNVADQDLVLESLSEEEDDAGNFNGPNNKKDDIQFNQRDRIILVPVVLKDQRSSDAEQADQGVVQNKQWLEDQQLISKMVQGIQSKRLGEQIEDIFQNKEERRAADAQHIKEDQAAEADEGIVADDEGFDLSVLELLDDQSEQVIGRKISKNPYRMRGRSKSQSSSSSHEAEKDKYRQYMSWAPQEDPTATTNEPALSKGQKKKLKKQQKQANADQSTSKVYPFKQSKEDMEQTMQEASQIDPFRIGASDTGAWQGLDIIPRKKETKQQENGDEWWKQLSDLDDADTNGQQDEQDDESDIEEYADLEAEFI